MIFSLHFKTFFSSHDIIMLRTYHPHALVALVGAGRQFPAAFIIRISCIAFCIYQTITSHWITSLNPL